MKKFFWVLIAMLFLADGLFAEKGRVRISCDKEGAYIYVDGQKKAMTGEGYTDILLPGGEYTIKVVKSIDALSQYAEEKKVFVGEDTSTRITFTLIRELTTKGLAAQAKRLKHYKRSGDVVIDAKRNLMWQDNASAKSTERNWSGAKSYCRNLSLAGYSDWRLPTYDELLSIVDYERYDPAIFAVFKNVASSSCWSSSVSVSYSSNAWGVDFKDGYTGDYGKSHKSRVRCVRAGQ